MGLGIGMVFTQGASTGGTDIVARLLRLKMPWLPLGKLMMLPDGIVLTLAVFAFGKLETGLYGLAALFVWDLSYKKYDLVERLANGIWLRYALWTVLLLLVLCFGAYGTGYDASNFVYFQF
jgi:hypothetical protein